MSIQFGGIASGLPVNDIIDKLIAIERRPLDQLNTRKTDIKQQGAFMDNTKSRISNLQAALKKLTSQSVLDKNLFQSRTATVADTSLASVTAGSTATPQTFSLEVVKLASSTKATSLNGVGQLATGSTPLSQLSGGGITSGKFNVVINGTAREVSVDATVDTMENIMLRLKALPGVADAQVDSNGKVVVTASIGNSIQFGTSADTTNFLRAVYLDTAQYNAGTNTYTASNAANSVNTAASIEDNALARLNTAVTAGSTFQIGAATFTTTGKSLNDLISEINNTADAKVTASFNTATNKLELVAKDTGSNAIFLKDTSGNFLSAMGLIDGGGSTITSQQVGNNAQFKINGVTLYSASNNVGETVSGLSGITLNLTKAAEGSPTTVTVNQDTKDLKEALQDLVKKYNDAIAYMDSQTGKDGKLQTVSSLKGFRNSLRTAVTDSVAGLTQFNSLPQIGLSTGAFVAGGAASPNLVFDEAKFSAAMSKSPAEVEKLLRGPGGILTQLQKKVNDALNDDPDPNKDGLFASYGNMMTSRIKSIDDAIKRGEDRVAKKEKMLRAQFQAMDQSISKIQSQGTAISNLASSLK
jgi:flagellar hook-associated protein 2